MDSPFSKLAWSFAGARLDSSSPSSHSSASDGVENSPQSQPAGARLLSKDLQTEPLLPEADDEGIFKHPPPPACRRVKKISALSRGRAASSMTVLAAPLNNGAAPSDPSPTPAPSPSPSDPAPASTPASIRERLRTSSTAAPAAVANPLPLHNRLPTPDLSRRCSNSFKLPRPSTRPADSMPVPAMKLSALRSSADVADEDETDPSHGGALLARPVSARGGYLCSGLPVVPEATPADMPCISPDTLVRLLRGDLRSTFRRVVVIDCRFGYEFRGGHIRDAVNVSTVEELAEQFMQVRNECADTCVVFHCEFSSHRGPTLWRALRKWDRHVNVSRYPELFYPHTYLLHKGYEAFYRAYPGLCDPQAYVQMTNKAFSDEMKQALQRMDAVRKASSRRGSVASLDVPQQLAAATDGGGSPDASARSCGDGIRFPDDEDEQDILRSSD
jgi:hypothetical protein